MHCGRVHRTSPSVSAEGRRRRRAAAAGRFRDGSRTCRACGGSIAKMGGAQPTPPSLDREDVHTRRSATGTAALDRCSGGALRARDRRGPGAGERAAAPGCGHGAVPDAARRPSSAARFSCWRRISSTSSRRRSVTRVCGRACPEGKPLLECPARPGQGAPGARDALPGLAAAGSGRQRLHPVRLDCARLGPRDARPARPRRWHRCRRRHDSKSIAPSSDCATGRSLPPRSASDVRTHAEY